VDVSGGLSAVVADTSLSQAAAAAAITSDIARISGTSNENYVQYLAFAILCKVGATGMSVLFINCADTSIMTTDTGAASTAVPIRGGLIIPLVTIGIMVGCVCSALLPSLPVGFCLCTFMLAIPTGVLTLLTDATIDSWFSSTTVLRADTSNTVAEGTVATATATAAILSGHRRLKPYAFEQITVGLISIPLLVAFLGFRQTVPLYCSLLTCYLGLRLILDHLSSDFNSAELLTDSAGSNSNSTIADVNSSGNGSDNGSGNDSGNDSGNGKSISSSDGEHRDKGNSRFRLFSPVTTNILASTHRKFLLTLAIVCMIRYFITVVLGWL
jgi:hypothetical protein